VLSGFAVGRRLVDVPPAVRLSGRCQVAYRKGRKSIGVREIGIDVLNFISVEFQSKMDPLVSGLLYGYSRAFGFALLNLSSNPFGGECARVWFQSDSSGNLYILGALLVTSATVPS
jgi:hypothetical protein